MPRVPPEIKGELDSRISSKITIDLDDTTIYSKLKLTATMAVIAYAERFLPNSKQILVHSKLT